MDERAVRVAVNNLVAKSHGLYMGLGEPCRMVPDSAIMALVTAVAGEAPEPGDSPDVPTTPPPADHNRAGPAI